jgi:hypothetical protein
LACCRWRRPRSKAKSKRGECYAINTHRRHDDGCCYSANKTLAYCKAMIGEDFKPENVAFASYCDAVIDTLVFVSPFLRDYPQACFQVPSTRYRCANGEGHHPSRRGAASENAREFPVSGHRGVSRRMALQALARTGASLRTRRPMSGTGWGLGECQATGSPQSQLARIAF